MKPGRLQIAHRQVAHRQVFSDAERMAWAKPRKLRPSEWAEKNRVIPSANAAEPGRLRLSRTPYIRGVMDATDEPGIEEVIFVAGTQVGKSTCTESLIGKWVDDDPGPIMLVLDTEKSAGEVTEERIRPLVAAEPLASHLSEKPKDNKLNSIKFDTCMLYLAWARSPGSLARRAVRRVIFDEVDKFPTASAREADPISLGIERTATYGYRRTVFMASTPTVRTGLIWRAMEAAGDRRRFWVPCPHCGEYQVLSFAQVKFPPCGEPSGGVSSASFDRNLHADRIETQGLAHYECAHCRKAIVESQRLAMVVRGVWLSDGHQTIDTNGVIQGKSPRAKRVAFWLSGSSLYSPWRTFSAVAAAFLRSLGDPGKLQNFRNAWLAEVFEETIKSHSVKEFRELLVDAPRPMLVPRWAEYIIAAADVQKDRIYWNVRAWGADYFSKLITYGIALSFEELARATLGTQFPLETPAASTSQAHLLVCDTRYRRDEVYQLAKTDQRIRPVMGGNDKQAMLVKFSAAGRQWGIPLYLLNTQLLKDRLSVLRSDGGAAGGSRGLGARWQLNSAVEEQYLQHLAAEHKVLIKGEWVWMPKTAGAANHWGDCEVYQVAGAEIARVDLLTSTHPETTVDAAVMQNAATAASTPGAMSDRRDERPRGNWLGKTKGWLDK